nr:hypothetical protein CPHELBEB_01578 [Escherichia coli]
MNSARRDLCGGYPVTGIPTATLRVTEKRSNLSGNAIEPDEKLSFVTNTKNHLLPIMASWPTKKVYKLG